MRLEYLQQFLGHSSIEVTCRYARLTDVTSQIKYVRTMAIIEKDGVQGDYMNRRPEYIAAFFNVINWDKVNEHFKAARG